MAEGLTGSHLVTCNDPILASLPRGKSDAHIASAAKLLKTPKKQAETFSAVRNYPQISLKRQFLGVTKH